MTTSLDVLDNAVKIGLGALLGGCFAFATQAFIQSQTRDREKQKELREHLYTIVSKIGKSMESVTHYIACSVVYNNYSSDPKAKADYEEANNESLAVWKGLLSVPHELELLGFSETSKQATKYFELYAQSEAMVVEFITTGDDPLRKKMHKEYENTIASIKRDYHGLF